MERVDRYVNFPSRELGYSSIITDKLRSSLMIDYRVIRFMRIDALDEYITYRVSLKDALTTIFYALKPVALFFSEGSV